MGEFAQYLSSNVLNYIFGLESYAPPITMYLGLSTATINDDGSGIVEPSVPSYSRIPINNNKITWTTTEIIEGKTVLKNVSELEFNVATEAWGTIVSWFIADAESGGNVLIYGTLDNPIVVNENNRLIIPSGAICISEGTATANILMQMSLNDLIDVNISSVDDGELIVYDSTTANWTNQTLTEAGIASAIHNHDNYQEKDILTTKGDLYIRDINGITRLPVGNDGEVLTADSTQLTGVIWTSSSAGGAGKQPLSNDITVTVGTGGNYSTINAALNYLVTNYYPTYLSTGTVPKATIQLLTGFAMEEQVLVEGLNLSWITITGVDAETVIVRSALVKEFGMGFPAFGVINGFLPIIKQLFNMDTSGTPSFQGGIMAMMNSNVSIISEPGLSTGIKNSTQYGLFAGMGSNIVAPHAEVSGVIDKGVWAMDSSRIVVSYANIVLSDAESGIFAENGSFINANNATVDVPVSATGIVVLNGSIIAAGYMPYTTFSQDEDTLTHNGIIFGAPPM